MRYKALTNVRTTLILLPLLAAIAVGLAVTVVSYSSLYKKSSIAAYIGPPTPEALSMAAHNQTLGFGEIVYISMPFRSDRQDAMNLLAAYSGIKIKLMPGVDGETMDPKERPDMLPPDVRPTELGCWRAHANAWRYMLDSNLETMLILEDDVDWDYHLKDVLQRLSLEMQNNPLRIDPITDRERAAAPYGLDWDVLVAGQCNDEANPKRRDLYYAYQDPNSPSADQIFERFIPHMSSLVDPSLIGTHRIISPSYGPVCTMGYAITRRGAMRLLIELSYLGLSGAVDEALIARFHDGGLRGYTITPPLFNGWRVNGAKDTDNQYWRQYDTVVGIGNLHAYSRNVKNSSRLMMVQELKQDNWARFDEAIPQDPGFTPRTPIFATKTFVPPPGNTLPPPAPRKSNWRPIPKPTYTKFQ